MSNWHRIVAAAALAFGMLAPTFAAFAQNVEPVFGQSDAPGLSVAVFGSPHFVPCCSVSPTIVGQPFLGVNQGGTGLQSLPANSLLLGQGGTLPVGAITANSPGQVLIDQGPGVNPQFRPISGAVNINSQGIATLTGGSGGVRNVNTSAPLGGGGPLSADLTLTCATCLTTTNGITNGNLAQAGAATLKGNPTASTANVQDFTIQGLTNTAPNSTLDFFPFFNHTTGTIQAATPSQISTAVGSGVTSLNSLTGALSIGAGNGIGVTPSGSTVTVAVDQTGNSNFAASPTSSRIGRSRESYRQRIPRRACPDRCNRDIELPVRGLSQRFRFCGIHGKRRSAAGWRRCERGPCPALTLIAKCRQHRLRSCVHLTNLASLPRPYSPLMTALLPAAFTRTSEMKKLR
jgi:hypothetical protein